MLVRDTGTALSLGNLQATSECKPNEIVTGGGYAYKFGPNDPPPSATIIVNRSFFDFVTGQWGWQYYALVSSFAPGSTVVVDAVCTVGVGNFG
jgi:hypothetical protein